MIDIVNETKVRLRRDLMLCHLKSIRENYFDDYITLHRYAKRNIKDYLKYDITEQDIDLFVCKSVEEKIEEKNSPTKYIYKDIKNDRYVCVTYMMPEQETNVYKNLITTAFVCDKNKNRWEKIYV